MSTLGKTVVSASRSTAAPFALTLLTSVYALAYADRSIINLLLDSIKLEFRLTDLQLGLITGLGFTAFQTLLGIIVARWADRSPRVPILTAGLLLWSVMTGVCGFAGTAFWLAVARMGVGVGEASLNGPAHSLLADFYPRERRPRAFSIMGAGGEIGVILAFIVGGWVGQQWGWRAAFWVAGMPGILLTLLLRSYLKEPVRGASDGQIARTPSASLADSLSMLVQQRSFVFAVSASMAMGLSIYGVQVWSASILRRTFHLNLGSIGTLIGVLRATLSVGGALLGGYCAALLIKRCGPQWFLKLPAVICAVCACALLAFLFAPNLPAAIVALGLVNMSIGAQLGPVFSAVQTFSPTKTRALAAALFVSLSQLFGLGVGSVLIGYLSDTLSAAHGASGLREAMLLPVAGAACGSLVYWLGSRYAASDLQRLAAP